MKMHMLRLLQLATALGLALAGCTAGSSGAGSPAASAEPVQIAGSFSVTNDLILTYYVENAVALIDMHGFVIRDQEWKLPVDSQVLGPMTYDPAAKRGSYELSLPAHPRGELNDVDNNGRQNRGVQIFAAAYSPNLTGGPFSEGDDPSLGWPSYLASVKTDPENHREVTGGKLVVWSPDAGEQFPSGFGEDGLLFTGDDPVRPITAGYTIIDLDKSPFDLIKTPSVQLNLYEPTDLAIKDFSGSSYTAAFDKSFETVRTEYAFNGIQGKQPDWDKLYAELRPRVEQAQKAKDARGFYLALRDLTWAFKDGHVSLQAGDYSARDFEEATAGGYGFAIRELDDGRSLVIYVMEGGPAASAGMRVGAEITRFNGKPIGEAIAGARSYALQSSDAALRYQQTRYLLRVKPGTKASVTFTNPGGKEQDAELTAIPERDSFTRTSVYFGANTDPLLPVESELMTEGNARVGYVRVNSNGDDLNLVMRLFQRALKEFQDRKVEGLIIDMRYNSGGANLGLAGFLTDHEIPMGQLEYYSQETGKFESDGPRQKVLPFKEQYHFGRMAVLVGLACYSACELEAYGFSQVPGMLVVGQYPTAGVEAEVARGEFRLPEGFSLQIPTGRFTLPDGSIFLEGSGVQPTLHVPVNEETSLSMDDVVLKAAMQAVLRPGGAGVRPAGPPKLLTGDEAGSELAAGANFLEDAAREKPDPAQFSAPGTTTYAVSLDKSEPLIWAYAWCAKDAATLEENLKRIRLKFVLDGVETGMDKMSTYGSDANGKKCMLIYAGLTDWPAGEHHLSTMATFTGTLNDGVTEFPAGEYVLEYTVYVGG
ncbi:MAG TPA: S41 family peptidase [Anaerolineales bacterium]